MNHDTIIVGAGPAGLAAAYELCRHGVGCTVLEAGDQIGGLSRTVERNGFRYDLGGHRFFTKIPVVRRLWDDLLGQRFMTRPRLSRIQYGGRSFRYPLRPLEALAKLGPWTALSVMASFLKARAFPMRPEDSFEAWVSNRFGHRLYEIFFRTYTEKVWGIPCTEISADWAAQRIRGLSLWRVVAESLRPGADRSHSLIERFEYPPLGPQEMWDALAAGVRASGGQILCDRRVVRLIVEGGQVRGVVAVTPAGQEEVLRAEAVISTMPLHELALSLDPSPQDAVAQAAAGLRYRAHLTVCLMVDAPPTFEDNWVYVHSDDVKMARLQNFTNWSPQMSPGPQTTALGVEYMAWVGDELWDTPDHELASLGVAELGRLGLVPMEAVREGFVVRSPYAYPVYDPGYHTRAAALRSVVDGVRGLQTCGRCGLHRYNNMDHSMLTGILAARNRLGESNDVWSVNLEAEYLEERA